MKYVIPARVLSMTVPAIRMRMGGKGNNIEIDSVDLLEIPEDAIPLGSRLTLNENDEVYVMEGNHAYVIRHIPTEKSEMPELELMKFDVPNRNNRIYPKELDFSLCFNMS